MAKGQALPWTGEMHLPPGGINRAYRPIVRQRPDGTMGMGFAKSPGYDAWAEEQVWLLRQQGAPRLSPDECVTIILQQRFRTARQDTDSVAKAVLDCLAKVFSLGQDVPWDDRACYFLLLGKIVDKNNPGITITVLPYSDQAIVRAYDMLLSMATCGKEGLA